MAQKDERCGCKDRLIAFLRECYRDIDALNRAWDSRLGRFDGENYNIGLFDICSRAYPEMMEQIKACSGRVYDVADGRVEPSAQKAKSIPMIAY